MKFNYVSIYVNVCSYNFVSQRVGEIQLKANYPKQQEPVNIQGEILPNISYVAPLIGQNHMIFVWNLDNTMPLKNLNIKTFEQSKHVKKCTINGNKYCKFHFRLPAECRRYVGCDHVATVNVNKNINDFLDSYLGCL